MENGDLYLAMKYAPVKPKRKNKKLEANEKDAVAALFVADGWEVINYSSGQFKTEYGWFIANKNYNTGATSGHPDLRATKNGISIAIECKKPKGGKVSDAQKKYREDSAKFGNMTIICRTKESAKEFLDYSKLYTIRLAVAWYVENYKQ